MYDKANTCIACSTLDNFIGSGFSCVSFKTNSTIIRIEYIILSTNKNNLISCIMFFHFV